MRSGEQPTRGDDGGGAGGGQSGAELGAQQCETAYMTGGGDAAGHDALVHGGEAQGGMEKEKEVRRWHCGEGTMRRDVGGGGRHGKQGGDG